MNQQNPTSEPDNQRPFWGFHTITDERFSKWTQEWYRQVASTETLWSSFRNNNGLMLKKIYFNDDTVLNLISSVGVENIHARFVIVDKYEDYEITEPTFTIILYATDNQEKRCSAYHMGKPQYYYDLRLEEGETPKWDDPHYICDNLAKKWIGGWKKIIQQTYHVFPRHLFMTNYGFLNGYNYLMSDFMSALYPPGSDIINYDVIILLAAHEHMAYNYNDVSPTMVSTFGLVLAGVEISTRTKDARNTQEQGVNSYYDLSLPCPPNQ